MTYEVVRDLAAFAGVITGAVIAFATWESLRAQRKPLELFGLHTGTGETVYVVPFSLANRTPSDRQIEDAWLDLAPPATHPHRVRRLFNMLMRTFERVVARRRRDIKALAVRHAVRQAGRHWVKAGGLQVAKPLYTPFKVGGFETEEGALFFPIFPWDEDLLNEHGLPATREFLDMLNVNADRAFVARFVVRDDRRKKRAVFVLLLPPPHLTN